MRRSTVRTFTWLDFYCLARSQFGLADAVRFLEDGNEAVEAAIQDAVQSADKSRLQGEAIGNLVVGAIEAAGAALESVPLAGAIIEACALLVRGIVAIFTVECDKYELVNPVSYYRRALVGVDPPPGATIHPDEGKSYWTSCHGAFQRWCHDGTWENGFGPVGETTDLGRVVGVNPRPKSSVDDRKRTRVKDMWRTQLRQPYTPKLAEGDLTERTWYRYKWDDFPYTEGTLAFRAGRAYHVMRWFQDALPGKFLRCGDDALRNTTAAAGVTEDGRTYAKEVSGQRVRGGRFYASVCQMHRDLQVALDALPGEQAFEILGKHSRAAVEPYKAVRLRRGPRRPVWPWWAFVREMTFEAVRDTLIELGPILAAGNEAQRRIGTEPSPMGAAARAAEAARTRIPPAADVSAAVRRQMEQATPEQRRMIETRVAEARRRVQADQTARQAARNRAAIDAQLAAMTPEQRRTVEAQVRAAQERVAGRRPTVNLAGALTVTPSTPAAPEPGAVSADTITDAVRQELERMTPEQRAVAEEMIAAGRPIEDLRRIPLHPTVPLPGVQAPSEGTPWWVWALGGGALYYFTRKR